MPLPSLEYSLLFDTILPAPSLSVPIRLSVMLRLVCELFTVIPDSVFPEITLSAIVALLVAPIRIPSDEFPGAVVPSGANPT